MKRNLFMKTALLSLVILLVTGGDGVARDRVPNHFPFTWETSSLPTRGGPVTVYFEFSPVEKCLGSHEFRVISQGAGGLVYLGPKAIVIEGTGAESYQAEIPVIVPEGDTCSVGILVMAGVCQAKHRVLFWPSDSGVQCGLDLPRPPKPPHPIDVVRATMTVEQLRAEYDVAVPYEWLVIPSMRNHLLRLLGPSVPPMSADSIYRNRTTMDMILKLDKFGVGFRDKHLVNPPPPR